MTLPVRIGSYDIEARLAIGGMAEVFLARWRRLDAERTVAIKRLLPQLATDPETLRLFRREVQIWAGLEHPHIVRLYDAGLDDALPYAVIEYVEGASLSDILKSSGTLPEATVIAIGSALAGALDYGHSRMPAVLHRDVSPQNVLISCQGDIKLSDFGIATAVGSSDKTADLRGKLAYIAPELLHGKKASPASDQYALGLVLYEALVGERAYPARSDVELLTLVSANLWQQSHPSWLRVAPPLRATIGRMLSQEPEMRWPNLNVVAQVLADLGTDSGAARQSLAAGISPRDRRLQIKDIQAEATLPLPMRQAKTWRAIGFGIVMAALVAFWLTACGDSYGVLSPTLFLKADGSLIESVALRLDGPQQREMAAPYREGELLLSGLQPGIYELTVHALTAAGDVLFAGVATAAVAAGETTYVQIELSPL